jgi:hypothetical protein
MKQIFVAIGILASARASYAAYPASCQLAMLSLAIPVLEAEHATSRFFDFQTIAFELSPDQNPIVVFEGSSSNLEQSEICRAEVWFKKPEDALGCPDYSVHTLRIACEARTAKMEGYIHANSLSRLLAL